MLRTLEHKIYRIETDAGSGFMSMVSIGFRTALLQDESIIKGFGFNYDPLKAFLAAQGEAIERLVFLHGHNFIDCSLSNDAYMPEEHSLLNPGTTLTTSSLAYPITLNGKAGFFVPRQIVHPDPRCTPMNIPFRMSTGWAFHSNAKLSAFKSASEVLERDMALRFWCLGEYGKRVSSRHILELGKKYLITANELDWHAFERKITHRNCSVNEQFFCLVAVSSCSPPYLTIGTGVADDTETAFSKALSELIHLRHYQWERLLAGTCSTDQESLEYGVDQSTCKQTMRDRILNIFDNEGTCNNNYDYSHRSSATVEFPMQALGIIGAVTKTWIDGCQPLAPPGINCTITSQWVSEHPNSENLWKEYRAHPFP